MISASAVTAKRQRVFSSGTGSGSLAECLGEGLLQGLVCMVKPNKENSHCDTLKERRWTPKFFIWLISYVVFPGLGFLVYFLYLNPDHRFVSKAP